MTTEAVWDRVPLVDLVEHRSISYGVVQPGDDIADGVPIVRVKDVRGGRISTDAPARVAGTIAAKHERTTLRGGELLVSLVGTVGESAVVPPELAGWNVARAIAVLRPVGVSARWIRLCLEIPSVQNQLRAVLNTTVQATLNLSDLKQVLLPVPPVQVQTTIEDVLNALDDKMTANARIASAADELASHLFAQAVRGVEPGDETFGQVADVRGGGTPSSRVPDNWGGDIWWATPTDVTGLNGPYLTGTARKITAAGLANCASAVHPVGSILMTSRATIGAFALAQVPTAVNQGFIVVVPNGSAPGLWLFHEMRSRIEEFTSLANGATFLELSRGNFKSFRVRLAEPAVMAQFQEQATALHDRAAAALRENQRLAATRDALLPALMSRRLLVRDADIGQSL